MSDVVDKRLEIVKSRINQYGMRFPVANIAGRIKFDRGYISAVLNGKKPMSDNFWSKFDEAFPEKNTNNGHGAQTSTTPDPSKVLLTGAAPTLQDYINEIKDSRDKWYNLVNSILGHIEQDTKTALAYQKAWIEYEAEKVSGGDEKSKLELMNKMSNIVRGYLLGRSSIHNETESGKTGKA